MAEKNIGQKDQLPETPRKNTKDFDDHIYEETNAFQAPGASKTEFIVKKDRFKNRTKEFVDGFECTKNEERAHEETFIIVHLLKKRHPNSPILDGNLEQLAMLTCCSSPHVVKRALDALLNEIFLSISEYSTTRYSNILKAEEILRASFLDFIEVDYLKAKCQRMTVYAWLITLVLLKCSKEECVEITPKIKEFDKALNTLLKDRQNNQQNTFRYGIYLARESIRRIIQSCGKKDLRGSLNRLIKKCENFLNGKLEKDEVMNLGKALSEGGSWSDLHVCLVFLQDLPKFYQFQDNSKPIILIQMLIADYRERCSAKLSFRRNRNYEWQFEILVYHVMLRLIRTSKSQAIIEQVLTGEQGCGGVLRSWIENKSKENKDEREQIVLIHLEKLCQRAIFVGTPNSFKQFLTDNCKGDEKQFIEDLTILHVSSTYKDKVLEILSESQVQLVQHRVNTYDALMNGKKCLLKLHQHSKEEVLGTDALKTVPLREEIEILKVLNAVAEPCPNIVQLLGSSFEAPMHLIMERTPTGDLLTYLQGLADPPEADVLLQIAVDVCNAMLYLGKHDIIHRDLRAKNCFVFMHEGKLLIKLGDFHLAILSYSGPKSPTGEDQQGKSVKSPINEDFFNQFAVRWMAAESLRLGEFSTATDVWSFGVLLFEIFTFGCKPYDNMPSGRSLDRDEEVREFILSGNRLELHPKISESVRELIKLTMKDIDDRPTFSGLKENVTQIRFGDVLYQDPAHYQILHRNIPDIS